MARAPFIVFEGLDGAGTTTQAHLLVDAIAAAGTPSHFTREPSDGPIGVMIRQALAGRLTLPGGVRLTPGTLALLFAADRLDHLTAEVKRLTEAGVAVVCDRYVLSSIAYQGQETDPKFVRDANAGAIAPDLTLFLRVSPETALARRSGRHLGEELYEKLETQKRVAAAYDEAVEAARGPHHVLTIDGEKGIDAVAWACLEAVRPLLAARAG